MVKKLGEKLMDMNLWLLLFYVGVGYMNER
jgi:hypothetical protein